MYDVALSVLSCLRADTAVHVAWVVSEPTNVANEAVAITPGGGRMGSLFEGALDHAITEAIPGLGEVGSLVEIILGPVEALLSGRDEGATVMLAIVPGTALPRDLWEDIAARRAVSFAFRVDGASLAELERLQPDEPGSTLASNI